MLPDFDRLVLICVAIFACVFIISVGSCERDSVYQKAHAKQIAESNRHMEEIERIKNQCK